MGELNRLIMEKTYIDIFLEPIFECLNYRPKFGHSDNRKGFGLEDFLKLYGNDPFYSWIGLNSPYLYTAHRVSGCMTSIYRQLGIGCERLFRQILCDCAKYEHPASAQWSYVTKTKSGKDKVLSLDGRLEIADIRDQRMRKRAEEWISGYAAELGVNNTHFKGAVFEVRQGYKSKDSKRQNGDLDNATVSYAYGYLPVFTIFSSQIDNDIVLRYRNNRCGIMTGTLDGSAFSSLFVFCKEILGFDMADFFSNNSEFIKGQVQTILEKLLTVDETAK